MLSRVANRIFWLSRYMERAENTARLVNVYTNLLLDLPINSKANWKSLMTITGSMEDFSSLYSNVDENNVINYLLTEKSNPASLYSSLLFARENARTTRDILPSEVWNVVNESHLIAKSSLRDVLLRTSRFKFLSSIIECGQRFEGIISSGMSRNDTYRFFILGRMLERADMITRVLDVGSLLLSEDNIEGNQNGIIWMNLLKSIAAYQMYRQSIKRRVTGVDVIRYLILNDDFPRSLWYCTNTISIFSSFLPKNENVDKTVNDLQNFINGFTFSEVDENKIHCLMDEIQKRLINLGNEIDSAWFNTEL